MPSCVMRPSASRCRGSYGPCPDLETVRASIVVPRVNVGEGACPFVGVTLLTTIRTTIGGPRLVDGSLELYTVRPIGGTAEAVEF